MKILLVDDEEVALRSVKRLLKLRGWNEVETCESGTTAVHRIKSVDFDLVLLDLLMPEVDGFKVLETAKPFRPYTEFIMLTALDDVSAAVRAIRLGAYDYLIKPVEKERLFLCCERAYEHKGLRTGFCGDSAIPQAFADTVTQNSRMRTLFGYAQIMARSDVPVLITGESGTGKELMAQGIHRAGLVAGGPFVAVNTASVPETLFESQFFGHLTGAFTGAEHDFKGYFAQADGGTLFLDEIGELPLKLQSRLLRVLEEQLITPLGDTRPIRVSVRVVAASNRDLDRACQQGEFRLDLLYRIKGAHVHLPPLRERREDIPLLAAHFLERACRRWGKEVRGFSSQAMEVLQRKNFPGNIRELAQMVERAVLLAETNTILPQHLGEDLPPAPSPERQLCTLKENEDLHVAYVLTHTRGDRKEVARILGITVRQVQRKLSAMRDDPRWKTTLGDI